MTEFRFIEPIDNLYLRGNKLFGGPGAHGESLMPPWPSIAAGSLRSFLLTSHGEDPRAFGLGRAVLGEPLNSVLGTSDEPGTFRVSLFALGSRSGEVVSIYFPLPADMVVEEKGNDILVSYMRPMTKPSSIQGSSPLIKIPILRTNKPFKPKAGLWLTSDGLGAYLNGLLPSGNGLVKQEELWLSDQRLGIALDAKKRTAETGRIYTAEAIAMAPNHGFVVGIDGDSGLLPQNGLLRFGGDGRGAALLKCQPTIPQPPWERIEKEKRFRMILAAPGIFENGWLIPGARMVEKKIIWEWIDFKAEIVAAAVRRFEVVSGWDLAREKPKRALRVVPTGSVYWIENLEGNIKNLRRVLDDGLWKEGDAWELARRAEGFNNVWIASWSQGNDRL